MSPDLEPDPGRDGKDAGYWGGGGVDDVGEFLAADLQSVGDRPHGVADHERVGVVVEEDRDTQRPQVGGKLTALRAGSGG